MSGRVDEQDWADFVEAMRLYWDHCAFQGRLVAALGGREDLAVALYGKAPANPLEWLERPVPALDGRRPIDILNGPGGEEELKAALMRMP